MDWRDGDLEAALTELGDRIDWPDTDLAPQVVDRLAGTAPARRRPRLARRLRLVAAAAVVILAVVSTPWGRAAVAGLLGIAGIEIRSDDTSEQVPGADFDLGAPVSLDEAAARAGFPLLVPSGSELGGLDAVYLAETAPGPRISMVWRMGPGLPAGEDTGIGLIYTQMDARFAQGTFVKTLGPGTELGSLVVRGHLGYWIEGAPHVIAYEDRDGQVIEETTRLAGSVLLWEEDTISHRIETTLPLEAALRLAESLRPLVRSSD